MGKTRKPKVEKPDAVKADRRAVKDLTPRRTQDVKGGEVRVPSPNLMKACATGEHIKTAIITV